MTYGLALAALLLAHVLRAVRQANLFSADERPRTIHLMIGLSIAYVLNAVLPFRLGEAARGVYVATRANIRLARVLATILAERLSDLGIVVAGLALLAAVTDGVVDPGTVVALAVGLVGVVGLAVALQRSARVRKLLWCVAALFNDRIRVGVVDGAWATVRLILGGSLLRGRYLALTVAMWVAYLGAYAAFARAANRPVGEVVAILLDSPLRSLVDRSTGIGSAVVLFTSLAAIIILVVGIAGDWRGIERSVAWVRRFGLPIVAPGDPRLRNAFVDPRDHDVMLQAHFTAGAPTIATFGQHGLGAAIVHRILPGGSDAVTAVVEVDGAFGIRKFATGAAAGKLAEQADWLDAHAGRLPLARVVAREGGGGRFRYDMPYLPGARDLYEVAHTAPAETCVALLDAVVMRIADHHAATAGPRCDGGDLDRYIDEKIVANARTALDFAALHLPKRYAINGAPFDVAEWGPLLDRDWVRTRLTTRTTAAIHGDLTVENIIVAPGHGPGWYLIDPNPRNLFDSPLIDWAKLLQSLHLGYETINRGAPAGVRDGDVTLLLPRSRVYADLHARYLALLAERFDPATLAEIHLHEIVNYLRLIPYKIRNQPGRALSFFACASLLLRRYREGGHG